jgi:glycosyltransferase involved in cell wall biosynthesis
MISLAITVCNESEELEALLDYLEDRALAPDYEIVVQIDKDNYTDEVLNSIINRGIKHHFFPLNKDFASYKNELKKHCKGEFIFQIDADELIPDEMLESLPLILEANPEVDLYYVPRINTVSGITQEHIQKWGWSISKLESQIGEKELNLNNPQDLDEYNLLKKYNLIIEENEIS